MKKYTPQDKICVIQLFEEGFSAREIFEEMGIPIGTLNRWKAEHKAQQAGAEGSELLQLRDQLEQLQQGLTQLREQLAPLQKDFEIRERARLRRLEELESENPGGLKLNIRR